MKTHLIIAAASIFLISSAYAENWGGIDFTPMDQNQDGKISKSEFEASSYQQAFNQADTNGDGKIDYPEWEKADTSAESRKHFDDLDTDRNSDLSLAEFKNGTFSFLNPEKVLNGKPPAANPAQNPTQIFNELDNDQNDLLTADEWPTDGGGVKFASFKF